MEKKDLDTSRYIADWMGNELKEKEKKKGKNHHHSEKNLFYFHSIEKKKLFFLFSKSFIDS